MCDKVGRERWRVSKMMGDKVVCDKIVRERWCVTKIVCDKVVCDKVVCDKVLCKSVCDEARGEGGGEEADGIQNQKQKTHTHKNVGNQYLQINTTVLFLMDGRL